jgi:hypothetical protein
MDLASAKMIGAGLAVIALAGVGAGIGNIFASLVASISRNPASRADHLGGSEIHGTLPFPVGSQWRWIASLR